MQSQFWQRTNFIKTKSRYCISLNEYIVNMIYNIASNTWGLLHGASRKDIIYKWRKRVQVGTSEQRTYKFPGKTHAFFKRYIFFHVFTSENMEDTSVLVYGETSITP